MYSTVLERLAYPAVGLPAKFGKPRSMERPFVNGAIYLLVPFPTAIGGYVD